MPKLHRLRLPASVHEFLMNEERAGNIVIGALAAIGETAFAASVLAMSVMR